eukprot:NODE_277_length_11973_cov_0.221895.p3 type:complete len:411 gc:universal NODE_277_length_11973_cov_0.221895:2052-820(-)
MFLTLTLAVSLSIDCVNVESLATGLGVDSLTIASIRLDCCNVNVVNATKTIKTFCDTSARVTEIYFNDAGLSGIINSTALQLLPLKILSLSGNQITSSIGILPLTLETLNVNYNKLSGALPEFPSSLVTVDVSNNLLTGGLPSLSNIISFNASNNLLTGSIPSFSEVLRSLTLSNNKIGGTIPGLPSSIESLDLSTNSISGGLPSIPTNLKVLKLGNNKISGVIPDLPLSLQIFNVENNQLSGSIVLNKPTSLLIQYNKFNNVSISDFASLSACDVSNNPLSLMAIYSLKKSICKTDSSQLGETINSPSIGKPTDAPSKSSFTDDGNLGYSGTNKNSQNTSSDSTLAGVAVGIVLLLISSVGITFFIVQRNRRKLERRASASLSTPRPYSSSVTSTTSENQKRIGFAEAQ